MRVISGKFKGRHLSPVRGKIRPSSDRLRETLFNIIGEQVIGSKWLDAFAGSGAVGIEALSRGARHVIFCDVEREAIRQVNKNLEISGVEEGAEIHEQDIFGLLRRSNLSDVDFVFLDPPYEFGRYAKLLQKVSTARLNPEALLILEVFKKTVVEPPPQLELHRTVQSGDSHLLFLKPRPADEAS